jgi:hypothetical protein
MEQSNEDMTVRQPQMGLTFEKVWAMFQETDRRMQETDRQMKETDKKMQAVYKQIGDLGNKFGSVVEHMMIPNIKEKFNLIGFEFSKVAPNVLIETKEEGTIAEIDIFLENGDCAMAVEVKSQPNSDDVSRQCERMKKLRTYCDKHNDRRKLYGAIAGAIISESVRNYALKKGLYIIEQSGDTVRIVKPSGEAKAW